MSALLTSETFRLFLNTLTPEDKYSGCNMQTFWQRVQTRLSQKRQAFLRFFIEFLKCAWNFENSEKKKEFPNLIFTAIIESERDVYLSV